MSDILSCRLTDFLIHLCQKEHIDSKDLRLSYGAISTLYQTKLHFSSSQFSKREALSYSLGRMPATVAVTNHVLERLKLSLPSFSPKTLLDLGSGPGSAVWTSLNAFLSLQTFTAVETNAFFVDISQHIFSTLYAPSFPSVLPLWKQENLLSFLSASTSCDTLYDMTILSYVLGEIPPTSHVSLVEKVWKKTKDILIFITPGTPQGFQDILNVRSFFIHPSRSNTCQILAPCPHQYACPLMGTQDWCHFSTHVPRSKIHTYLKEGSLPYEQEKFSYLIIKKGPPDITLQARIIKKPLIRKGHTHIDLCTPTGTVSRITVSKRQKNIFSKTKHLTWGDSWPFS